MVRLAVIAGSGLAEVVGRIDGRRRPWEPEGVALRQAAPGHAMEVVEGTLGGAPALGFAGRLHFYQGYSMAEVAAPVREAHRWGAEALFVTNAAGSLRPDLLPGSLVLLADHVSLMPDNPLRGQGGPEAFVGMAGAYDPGLRSAAAAAAASLGIELAEGIYVGLPGPSFETPAEVRALRTLGGDVVGMSTVPEVIAARALGLRVLGLSVVTNQAGSPELSPAAVLEVSGRAAGRLADLLEAVAAAALAGA